MNVFHNILLTSSIHSYFVYSVKLKSIWIGGLVWGCTSGPVLLVFCWGFFSFCRVFHSNHFLPPHYIFNEQKYHYLAGHSSLWLDYMSCMFLAYWLCPGSELERFWHHQKFHVYFCSSCCRLVSAPIYSLRTREKNIYIWVTRIICIPATTWHYNVTFVFLIWTSCAKRSESNVEMWLYCILLGRMFLQQCL